MTIVPRDPREPITDEMWRALHVAYPDAYMREVRKAMLISTDREACCALLQGESVPPERIDWVEARRFGSRL